MEIKQEEYNYKVKELEVNRTQKSLEQSTVTSTVAGIVQEINEQQGTDPSTGESKPFMSILSTGKYRIKGKISEQNIGDLTPGTQVTIRSRVNEDEIWTGTVDNVDKVSILCHIGYNRWIDARTACLYRDKYFTGSRQDVADA